MNRAPNLQNSVASDTRKTPEKERADYDYKEIAREVLARIDQRLADLEGNAPPRPSRALDDRGGEEAGEIEPGGERMNPDDRSALVNLVLRGLFGLVAVASLFGAIAYLWSHLDAAEQAASQLSPRAMLSSVMPEDKAQPSPPAAARVVAEATSAQAAVPAPVAAQAQAGAQVQAALAASPARIASDNDKPAPASLSPELAALLRKLDRDVAGLAQAVNELRDAQQQASQQASDDTTKSADEIKAGVNQLARSIVKAEQEEQITRQKPAAAPARTASPAPAPRNRRGTPMYYSPRDAQAEFLR
ncbi:MAG TPA: hypothetical protein VMM15_37570 [Bradyrhizobium sp.]|nr:hypothetical protein [Bradyrhizobium sp.]